MIANRLLQRRIKAESYERDGIPNFLYRVSARVSDCYRFLPNFLFLSSLLSRISN